MNTHPNQNISFVPGGVLSNLAPYADDSAAQKARDESDKKLFAARYDQDDVFVPFCQVGPAAQVSFAGRLQHAVAPKVQRALTTVGLQTYAQGLNGGHVAELAVWTLGAVPVRFLLALTRERPAPEAAGVLAAGMLVTATAALLVGRSVQRAPAGVWPGAVLVSALLFAHGMREVLPPYALLPVLLLGASASVALQVTAVLPPPVPTAPPTQHVLA